MTLALNISVYVASQEKIFLELNTIDVFQRFIKLIKRALDAMDGTPDVGYVRLMSAFLKHRSGCHWMIKSTYWSEIILLTLSSTYDSDFAKAGYAFISKLIANSAKFDSKFCSKVISLIIGPILDIEVTSDNFDSSIIKNRESSFNLVTAVLENLLEERVSIIHEVVFKVISDTKFETHLDQLSEKIADESISFPITVLFHLTGVYGIAVEQIKCHLAYLEYEYFF